jgi:colanic acid biosynthesis glycosyl transferase WcaI
MTKTIEDRSLKIAFITQYFHPEQFLNNTVATSLVERGHEVQVICAVPNYGKTTFFDGYSNSKQRTETWKGVRIARAFTIARGKSSAQLCLNYLVYPFAGLVTFVRRKRWTPDVSFVSMPSPVFQAILGWFLNKFWSVPSVHWVQDLWPDTAEVVLSIRSPLLRFLLRSISGYLYRNAQIVLIQSEAFRKRLIELGVEPDKIRPLPNTAPPFFKPMLKKQAPEQAKFFSPNNFNIVFAGNIGESQDFPTILQAIELAKEDCKVNLVVIGSGRGLDIAVAEVAKRKLGSCVSFIGRHDEEVMPLFFAHADALLVSLKDTPIFASTVPFKVQCYLACGKPIIASLSGEGARVLLESNAACVAPSGCPLLLAQSITALSKKSAAERQRMGLSGRSYFESKFSPAVVFDILEKALFDARDMRR